MDVSGEAVSRRYSVRLDAPQALSMRIPLYMQSPSLVCDAAGNGIAYTLEQHPAGNFMHVEFPVATEHVTRVDLSASPAPPELACGPACVEVARPSNAAPVALRKPLDLRRYFNSDRIRPCNFWDYLAWLPDAELTYDLRPYVEQDGAEAGYLTVDGYRFTVRPTGQNLVALAMGDLDVNTNAPIASAMPSELTLEVRTAIAGLEFLTVSEPRVRLTGMEVGRIECRYSDGSIDVVPLIVGEQLDSTLSAYAAQTTNFTLAKGRGGLAKNISAWAVAANPARVTESVTMRITSFDIMAGILAVNIRTATP